MKSTWQRSTENIDMSLKRNEAISSSDNLSQLSNLMAGAKPWLPTRLDPPYLLPTQERLTLVSWRHQRMLRSRHGGHLIIQNIFYSSIRSHRHLETGAWSPQRLFPGQKVTSSDRMMETICCEKAAAYFLMYNSFSVYTHCTVYAILSCMFM